MEKWKSARTPGPGGEDERSKGKRVHGHLPPGLEVGLRFIRWMSSKRV